MIEKKNSFVYFICEFQENMSLILRIGMTSVILRRISFHI